MSKVARSSLALSQPLLGWLREDPAWAALPMAQRARLVWQARWGSINSGLTSALATQRAPVPLEDPVLIVGPWRSGTTVMHELLAAAIGSTTPRTWQCMNACAFELTPRRRGAAAIARPMDGLEISDESPQEDEFALLSLGIDSAYRAFWMPHRIGELRHTLDPQYWLDHPQWLDAWERFLRGVLATNGHAAAQPLLLKSPGHTYRVASILRRFPRARLVWMVRDPSEVFHSNRKMWSQMFVAHGLAAPHPSALDDFLAEMLSATACVLEDSLDLTFDRLVYVAHESLLERPADVMASVRESLRLPTATDRKSVV